MPEATEDMLYLQVLGRCYSIYEGAGGDGEGAGDCAL